MAREFVSAVAVDVPTLRSVQLTHAEIAEFSVRFAPPTSRIPFLRDTQQWPIMQVRVRYGLISEVTDTFMPRYEEEYEFAGDDVYALLDVAGRTDTTLLAYIEKLILSRRGAVVDKPTYQNAAEIIRP